MPHLRTCTRALLCACACVHCACSARLRRTLPGRTGPCREMLRARVVCVVVCKRASGRTKSVRAHVRCACARTCAYACVHVLSVRMRAQVNHASPPPALVLTSTSHEQHCLCRVRGIPPRRRCGCCRRCGLGLRRDAHVQTHMSIHMSTHMSMHTSIRALYTCLRTCIYTCLRACLRECRNACLCMSTHMHLHVPPHGRV